MFKCLECNRKITKATYTCPRCGSSDIDLDFPATEAERKRDREDRDRLHFDYARDY